MAATAALGLVVSLFLPWYQETVITKVVLSASLTGWSAFSFVEAAVLLLAGAVLGLLFVRAEGSAFHVPGGDGGVITAAGLWACVLIVWRMFDKQGQTSHGLYPTTTGIEWGIFVALGVAALLAYAGSRIKLANEPEPPLPGERPSPRLPAPRTPAPAGPAEASAERRRIRRRRRLDFSELEQLDLDAPPEAPTLRRRTAEGDDPLTERLNRPD